AGRWRYRSAACCAMILAMSAKDASPAGRGLAHRVKLPPIPVGYGRRLHEIEAWCRSRCGAQGEGWDAVGTTFRFADAALAAEFARLFAPKPARQKKDAAPGRAKGKSPIDPG